LRSGLIQALDINERVKKEGRETGEESYTLRFINHHYALFRPYRSDR